MRVIFLAVLLLCLAQASQSRSVYNKKYSHENKVALVIGNGNYVKFSSLKNAINDAKDMKNSLEKIGFEVYYLSDGNLKSMKQIVRQFTHKLKEGGVGLFYYAGHGLQVEDTNYLLPLHANIPVKNEVEFESLSMNYVIQKMEDSHNRLNVIILDACRNDPFSRGGGGLAQIHGARGMYIAFATAPGDVASDGSGENGLFTKHLLANLENSQLDLDGVFKETRTAVYNESNGGQLPWTSSSVIGDFYFHNNKTTPASPPPPAVYAKPVVSTPVVEKKVKRYEKEKQVPARPPVVKKSKVKTTNPSTQTFTKPSIKPSKKGLYVCYKSKVYLNNKSVYKGCVRSTRPCAQNGKEHFGKYPNTSKANAAMQRCVRSKPIASKSQSKPVQSSSKKRYVCYNKKVVYQNRAIYLGCSQESTKCSNIGKYHFGKYPNNSKVNAAFRRCARSDPKFVDHQGL